LHHPDAIMEERQRQPVHWRIPTLMLGMLMSGVSLAIGHHLFYQSLHGKSISGTRRGDNQPLTQQVSIAIGTAFAFLVKAALVISVNTAYYQSFWKMAKQKSTKALTLDWLDTAFSGATNAMSLLKVPSWLRNPLLFTMGTAIWYVEFVYLAAWED
jgi:hypothetical protein